MSQDLLRRGAIRRVALQTPANEVAGVTLALLRHQRVLAEDSVELAVLVCVEYNDEDNVVVTDVVTLIDTVDDSVVDFVVKSVVLKVFVALEDIDPDIVLD